MPEIPVELELSVDDRRLKAVTAELRKWVALTREASAFGVQGAGGAHMGRGGVGGIAGTAAIAGGVSASRGGRGGVGFGGAALASAAGSNIARGGGASFMGGFIGAVGKAALALAPLAAAAYGLKNALDELSKAEQLKGKIRNIDRANELGLISTRDDGSAWLRGSQLVRATGISRQLAADAASLVAQNQGVLGFANMNAPGSAAMRIMQFAMSAKNTLNRDPRTVMQSMRTFFNKGSAMTYENVTEVANALGVDPEMLVGAEAGVLKELSQGKMFSFTMNKGTAFEKTLTQDNWQEHVVSQVRDFIAAMSGQGLTAEQRNRGWADFQRINKEYAETIEGQVNKMDSAWTELKEHIGTAGNKFLDASGAVVTFTEMLNKLNSWLVDFLDLPIEFDSPVAHERAKNLTTDEVSGIEHGHAVLEVVLAKELGFIGDDGAKSVTVPIAHPSVRTNY